MFPKHQHFLAGIGGADLDCVVVAVEDQQACAIGVECSVIDVVWDEVRQFADHFSGVRVADPEAITLRTDEQSAIGAEDDPINLAFDGDEIIPRQKVPDVDYRATRCQPPAIGSKRQAIDPRAAVERLADREAGRGVPDPRRAIVARGRERITTRLERRQADCSRQREGRYRAYRGLWGFWRRRAQPEGRRGLRVPHDRDRPEHHLPGLLRSRAVQLRRLDRPLLVGSQEHKAALAVPVKSDLANRQIMRRPKLPSGDPGD